MEGGALVGELHAVDPLSDEVETTAAQFIARGVPFTPALSEILINLYASLATAALRFPPLRGLEAMAGTDGVGNSPLH
jgi:hypothetical protein